MVVPAGTVFADLVVLSEVERSGPNRRFLCRCKCGAESVKFLGNLRLGRSTTCGTCRKSGEAGRAASLAARHARARISTEGRMCLVCKTWQPWDNFTRSSKHSTGRATSCRGCGRRRALMLRYGIDEVALNLLRGLQPGCHLCQSVGARLVIDHDHNCCGYDRGCRDCIRGLLCDFCNLLLGRVEQKQLLAERFADYLSRRPLL